VYFYGTLNICISKKNSDPRITALYQTSAHPHELAAASSFLQRRLFAYICFLDIRGLLLGRQGFVIGFIGFDIASQFFVVYY